MSEREAYLEFAEARRSGFALDAIALCLMDVIPVKGDIYDPLDRSLYAAMSLIDAKCTAAEANWHLTYLRENKSPTAFDVIRHLSGLGFDAVQELIRGKLVWDAEVLKAKIDAESIQLDRGAAAAKLREWCIDAAQEGARAYTMWSTLTQKPKARLPAR